MGNWGPDRPAALLIYMNYSVNIELLVDRPRHCTLALNETGSRPQYLNQPCRKVIPMLPLSGG